MNQKISFIHTEFMTWLTRTRKTKPSSAKHHTIILNTMLSLIFGTIQVSTTAQRLTTYAISNHQINNPRYGSTWDINQLFEHWRKRPESNLFSNEELQVKPASLQMSFCFVRMEEMANIDLSVSIIDDQEHTSAVCIPPKQSVQRERYNIRKTEESKVCSTKTFFAWLIRLREHLQKNPTNFIHQFWSENWEQADQKCISTRLERLVQTLRVKGATGNSKRHASSIELAAQGFDGRIINVFTHHTSDGWFRSEPTRRKRPDSKLNKKFYIFAVNKERDSIAFALVKIHGDKQATQIISKQRGDARLSPQETLASLLSLPIIPTQPIVEADSPNDRESAKIQNSQMQKDDQDVEPQENSSMTKDSDRATTAQAQKQ
ncbi:MAG: hypothetical protein EZS28_014285 [Streblomastix strix]|uniref:Uncharacterized protein n=1 Tax=Streblomastix strix TaxID=222440 RepID=A0A5J4W5Q8_9EUKA|nr:MAG: hypothetical protein EZS28_014285 [Streblomastix strix]